MFPLWLATVIIFYVFVWLLIVRASLVAQVVKNVSAMQETQVQSLGGDDPLEKENGNPLQYSCLENSMDRVAWWATVCGIAIRWTWLSDWVHTYTHTHTHTHTQLLYHVVLFSAAQRRESAVCIPICLLFQLFFPFRSTQSLESRAPCASQ